LKAYDRFLESFVKRFGLEWVSTSRIVANLNVSKKYIYDAKRKGHLKQADSHQANPFTSGSGKLSNYYQITVSGVKYLKTINHELANKLMFQIIKYAFEHNKIPISRGE